MKSPREKEAAHSPEMRPYVEISSGNPPALKNRFHQNVPFRRGPAVFEAYLHRGSDGVDEAGHKDEGHSETLQDETGDDHSQRPEKRPGRQSGSRCADLAENLLGEPREARRSDQ